MKKIAVFDYRVKPTNPIGGCHRRMMEGLSGDHDFTVFAVEFDNPAPDRIHFHRVPVPKRPLALLYLSYHLVAPICYLLYRLRGGNRFDVIQSVESNLGFGNVVYAQFCHRGYLKLGVDRGSKLSVRRIFRWLDHGLHALLEPWVYRRAEQVIVPSRGTARELEREYPVTKGKIRVIYNAVDLDRMRRPADFDPMTIRRDLGWGPDDIVLVFVALGHFERKGLPALMEAVRSVAAPNLKILVVGGIKDLIEQYGRKASSMGLDGRIAFTGNQKDVRPFLWAADAFTLPSFYEAFPLVSLEAAAAGLPLIASRINGVEELLRDGENGFAVEQEAGSIATALQRFLSLDVEARRSMGAKAAQDVERYAIRFFAPNWRDFYASLDARPPLSIEQPAH